MSAKIRRSKQRDVILNILEHDESHPTAEDIYQQARRMIPDISLGTVYRNLKFLKTHKMISSLKIDDATVHYDANLDSHHHFVCEQCGKIIDIPGNAMMQSQLQDYFMSMDLQLQDHPILFHGLCTQCKN